MALRPRPKGLCITVPLSGTDPVCVEPVEVCPSHVVAQEITMEHSVCRSTGVLTGGTRVCGVLLSHQHHWVHPAVPLLGRTDHWVPVLAWVLTIYSPSDARGGSTGTELHI